MFWLYIVSSLPVGSTVCNSKYQCRSSEYTVLTNKLEFCSNTDAMRLFFLLLFYRCWTESLEIFQLWTMWEFLSKCHHQLGFQLALLIAISCISPELSELLGSAWQKEEKYTKLSVPCQFGSSVLHDEQCYWLWLIQIWTQTFLS